MTKFRTILFTLAVVTCTACNSPTNAANDAPAAPAVVAETPAAPAPPVLTPATETDPPCNGHMETDVQVRGIPVAERPAASRDIRDRVLTGELPRESNNHREGNMEARWSRECKTGRG